LILRDQECSFGLRDDTLFWQNVIGFFSLSFSPFSYEKPLFLGNSIVFNLEFSLSTYWELMTNFEFKFKFDLNFGLAFSKNIPYDSFLLTLSCGFLHLMLPRGMISLADHPHHQLEINLITNIWSWSIGWLWIHHKILMSTNALTSRFGFVHDCDAWDKDWSPPSSWLISFFNLFLFYFIYKWALICLHDRFVLNGNTTYVVPFFQL